MTQDELTLVLDALKWCHGGEPCGTAEAIAVVEKALANVATNDTSKEYVDEMQKQRHEQEPVTTVEDNSQQWKGMDGAIAFHLIERHADGWNDIRKMMGEWLSANAPQRTERPADCERCNRLEEQAYDLVGKLKVANIKLSMQPQRTWQGLTEEDKKQISKEANYHWEMTAGEYAERIGQLTEAKLKEKNT